MLFLRQPTSDNAAAQWWWELGLLCCYYVFLRSHQTIILITTMKHDKDDYRVDDVSSPRFFSFACRNFFRYRCHYSQNNRPSTFHTTVLSNILAKTTITTTLTHHPTTSHAQVKRETTTCKRTIFSSEAMMLLVFCYERISRRAEKRMCFRLFLIWQL